MGKTEIAVLLCVVGVGAVLTVRRSTQLLRESYEREEEQALRARKKYPPQTFGGYYNVMQGHTPAFEPVAEDIVDKILRQQEAKSFTKSSEFEGAGWVYDAENHAFVKELDVTVNKDQVTFTLNDVYTVSWVTGGASTQVNTVVSLPSGEVNYIDEQRSFLQGLLNILIPEHSLANLFKGKLYRNLRVEMTAHGVEFDDRKPKLGGASTMLALPPAG